MSKTDSALQTPAHQHASTFADSEGRVTDATIAARQVELNDTGSIAEFRKRAVLTAIEGQPTVDHLCNVGNSNPARSGIWNADGTLNQGRLKELKDRCAVAEDGTRLLTKSVMKAFIKERRAGENKSFVPHLFAFGIGAWVKPHRFFPFKIPVPNVAVTDGSVDAFFVAYADRQHGGKPAVAWNAVCKFYDPQNSSQLRDNA